MKLHGLALNFSVGSAGRHLSLTPILFFLRSHFRSVDADLKEDTLELLMKGALGSWAGELRVSDVCGLPFL